MLVSVARLARLRAGVKASSAPRAAKPAQHARDIDRLTKAPANGHFGAMLIYKIFRAAEWAELRHYGVTAGAPVDVADGYVHFSTADQAARNLRQVFCAARTV